MRIAGVAPEPAVAQPGDPEAAYYQAIEEYFVSRRGDPLFLSNSDWLLIRKWRLAGIPLRVVLRGIRDALDGHAVSWSRDQKVGSLRYCAAEVEAAVDRWRRALSLGSEEGIDVGSFLGGFALALEGATLGPAASVLAPSLARELKQEAAGRGAVRDLEPWLVEREAALLGALRADAGSELLCRIETAVNADLAPYLERLPERVFDQVRRESFSRRLLEAHGLPRLSLVLL